MTEPETFGLKMIDGRISQRGWERSSEVFLAGLWIQAQRETATDEDAERFSQVLTLAADARGDSEGDVLVNALQIAEEFMG